MNIKLDEIMTVCFTEWYYFANDMSIEISDKIIDAIFRYKV